VAVSFLDFWTFVGVCWEITWGEMYFSLFLLLLLALLARGKLTMSSVSFSSDHPLSLFRARSTTKGRTFTSIHDMI